MSASEAIVTAIASVLLPAAAIAIAFFVSRLFYRLKRRTKK